MNALLINACYEYTYDNFSELKELAIACNFKVSLQIQQNIKQVNKRYLLGKGKVDEIKQCIQENHIDVVIFNQELSPLQTTNLQDEWQIEILDRTTLILNIFALRAQSKEAKLQVELAKLNYLLPRLVFKDANLEQQSGGAVKNKGRGEKQIDLDRRTIQRKIDKIKKDLELIEKQKQTASKSRLHKNLPLVALVGYTNAGKSTLMNAFLTLYGKNNEAKKVLEKDMLFATLDTSVRKITLDDKKEFLLSDTVGFVSSLPHGLIKAFKTTLAEVRNADLILNVLDISDQNFFEQVKVVNDTLEEIGITNTPIIRVFNKIDKISLPADLDDDICVCISAKNMININKLVKKIKENVFKNYLQCKMFFPYNRTDAIYYLNKNAKIINQKNENEGVFLTLECSVQDYRKYIDYVWIDSKN